MGLLNALRRNRHERRGFELYGVAVASARQPWFYTALAVPDTLDGRFDLVGLHAWLLIRQLSRRPPPGPALAQAIFDAMFADMDVNLREMGVSDLSVGKKVKVMWEAFHGRATAYEAAIDDPDPTILTAALRRNIWRGTDAAAAASLADYVRAQDDVLATQDLAGGVVRFVPAPPVSAVAA